MPRALTWGTSIDAVELSSSTTAASSRPRLWEIRAKAGGGCLGMVSWEPQRREYIFRVAQPPLLTSRMLIDIGKFCQNRTDAQLIRKVEAAG